MYLWPLNDLALELTINTVSPTTGATTVLTSGTVTGFLATTASPTATAADPSLQATVNFSATKRKWIVTMDAALLTASLLATHFAATGTAYLILQSANNVRGYLPLTYSASREITLA